MARSWPHRKSMLYLAQHLAAVAAFLLLSFLAGWVVEHLGFRRVPLGRRRNLARWCLGLAFWMAVTFTLAATHTLTPGLLRAVGVLVVVAAVGLGWRPRPPSSWPGLGAGPLGAVVLGLVLLPYALFTAGPQLSWDAGVYHLNLPRLFLEAEGFRSTPFLAFTHWPLNGELLFTAVLGLTPLPPEQGYPAGRMLHLALGLLALYALGCCVGGPRRRRRQITLWAACFFLANGVLRDELRVAYVELFLAFFLTAAVAFLARALRRSTLRRGRGELLLVGICGGVLAGLKVNGFLLTAALVLALLVAAGGRWRWPAALKASLLVALPAAVLALPWPVKAWLETGNPVYPLLYDVFGGPAWSATVGEQFATWQREIGMGREPLDYLLLPWRVIVYGDAGYDHFGGEVGLFWLLLLPLTVGLLALRRTRPSFPRLGRLALGISGLGFLFWAVSSQQLRFLVPILPLLAEAAAAAVWIAVDRLPVEAGAQRLLRHVVSGAALVLVVLTHASMVTPGLRSLALFLGYSPEEILATARPPVFEVIDRDLEPDARLLMLHTNWGFFCRREYIADTAFEASQIADWLRTDSPQEVARRLAAAEVTHVLVERPGRGDIYPPALVQLVTDPRVSRPHYYDAQYALLRLNLGPAILGPESGIPKDDPKEKQP